MTAPLGGHIDTLVTAVNVAAQQIKAGAVRALAAWGGRRVPAMPDTPTFKELGNNVKFYLWVGMFAPKGTPAPVLKALRDAVRQTVNDPDFKAAMTKPETPIEHRDGDDFQKRWDREYAAIGEAIKQVGKAEVR
jgi:tripartite-type tricarboxylate transporter receptor subunit TctC